MNSRPMMSKLSSLKVKRKFVPIQQPYGPAFIFHPKGEVAPPRFYTNLTFLSS